MWRQMSKEEWFKVIRKSNGTFDIKGFDKSKLKGIDEYAVMIWVSGCLKTWKEEDLRGRQQK